MSEFVVDYRMNNEFKAPIALSFTVEGAGAAAMVWGMLFGSRSASFVGLLFIFAGIVVLMFDLGSPFRFWRVIAKTGSSWISRGSLVIGCLAASGTAYFVMPGLFPDYAGPHVMAVLAAFGAIFAFMVMLYPGLLLSSMTPIPFWNTPIVPVLFLVNAATTGLNLLVAAVAAAGPVRDFTAVLALNCALLLVSLGLTCLHVAGMMHSTNAARQSARILTRGRYRALFIAGAVFAGVAAPLMIAGYMYASAGGAGVAPAAVMSAFFRLCGDFFYRNSVMKAGIFEPVI